MEKYETKIFDLANQLKGKDFLNRNETVQAKTSVGRGRPNFRNAKNYKEMMSETESRTRDKNVALMTHIDEITNQWTGLENDMNNEQNYGNG